MPADRHAGSTPGSEALEIFVADYLRDASAGRPIDFEAVCSRHPEQASALRALKSEWDAQARMRELAGLGPVAHAPISQALRERYGEGVDPGVSLAGEAPETEPSPTQELLQRLQTSGPSNTRYKFLGEVGRGGMGAILKVWDGDLRRPLAMKVAIDRSQGSPAGGDASTQHRLLGRFLEEAQITGQLDHPGIVPVHELGLASDGRVYFTMRLVKGIDLKAVFDLARAGEDGWSETRALGVLLKVCEAMSYAHDKGVVHRDLKPANVMVGKYGEVYVMDWGLARVQGRADKHDLRLKRGPQVSMTSVRTERREEREDAPDSPIMTMDGDVLGTPAYMPPEQATGNTEQLGPWSDVYAVGAMMYHLLSGCMPFVPRGARVTARTVLMRVLEGPPQPLHELAASVPSELVAICEKAMAREIGGRYPDMIALADDLRAYLEGRVVAAYETGTWAETRKWVQRNKRLAASVAVGVLCLVAWVVTASVSAKRERENALTLAAANTALEARTTEAQTARVEADAQARIAKRKTADVLSLSAIQELKELESAADALWPAYPENSGAYEAWLEEARILISGSPGDSGSGLPGRLSLADHESRLAELRRRARPRAPEQREKDRKASPYFTEWERVRAEHTWIRRMLGEEPWPDEQAVGAASPLARSSLPAEQFARLAWSLVDPHPENVQYGHEIEALVLAKRAVAVDGDATIPWIRDMLALALCRCGRFDEALGESDRALAEASDEMRPPLAQSRVFLDDEAESWRSDFGLSEHRRALSDLGLRAEHLERLVDAVQTLEFDEVQDRIWHRQLQGLVLGLYELTSDSPGRSGLDSTGISPTHGWGIRRRAEEARTVRERSVVGSENEAHWASAIEDIAQNANYRGVRWPSGERLTPQVGLIPLEADPRSGLWEFTLVQSGEVPPRGLDGRFLRDAEGRFQLEPESGIVLVLLPGGRFTMGAQSTDPTKPNYDRAARPEEAPQTLKLDPFLLSKYEMTQAQWLRFTGENPSVYQPRANATEVEPTPLALLHPVEAVSWVMCDVTLRRLGLCLPTEAQWEYGCRGGTSTPYWCGADKSCLSATGNVYDLFAKAAGSLLPTSEEWDDGHKVHAEVGTFLANPFGLHDVHGNVYEWCRDRFGTSLEFQPGDGERLVEGTESRVARGGSFAALAVFARSASKMNDSPNVQNKNIGVRPAMAVRP